MISGVLGKRNSPVSPPPMQKSYCVLWGTLLLDYDSEEDSKKFSNPKSSVELIGVSDWDGQGRANKYPYGFLAVSHTGATYYMSANTAAERDDWVLHIKCALECNFANPELLPFKPSKSFHRLPDPMRTNVCFKSGIVFGSTVPVFCKCCGNYFLSDYMQESSPMLQIGVEVAEKICCNCKSAQNVIIWLKVINYLHCMTLHEKTSNVLKSIYRFKSSFKLRRIKSARLDMAAKMLEEKLISHEEFDELRKVDQNFLRDWQLEESERLRLALDALDNDLHIMIGMLINSSSQDHCGIRSYYELISKIIQISEEYPDLIDFYWPQILHAHIRIAKTMTTLTLAKVDLLQQTILVISLKYTQIALKTAWALIASCHDYTEKRINASQYAACLCLLIQLNAVIAGTAESLSDKAIPPSSVFGNQLIAAEHQKNEIKNEIRVLMRCRRRLFKIQDDEDREKLLYNSLPYQNRKRSGYNGDVSRSNSNTRDDNNLDQVDFPNKDINNTISNNDTNEYPEQKRAEIECHRQSNDRHQNHRHDEPVNSLSSSEPKYSDNQSDTNPSPVLFKMSSCSLSDGYSNNNDNMYQDPLLLEYNTTATDNGGDGASVTSNYLYSDTSSNLPPVVTASPLLQLLRVLGKEVFSSSPNSPDYVIAAPPLLKNRLELSQQLDWMNMICDIVDRLRLVDRPLRTDSFRSSLSSLNDAPEAFGYDPTTAAGEPRYRIVRILLDNCRVFRTKARAPSMIVCEVARVEDEEEEDEHAHRKSCLGKVSLDSHLREVDTILQSAVSLAAEEIRQRRDSEDGTQALYPTNSSSDGSSNGSDSYLPPLPHPPPSSSLPASIELPSRGAMSIDSSSPPLPLPPPITDSSSSSNNNYSSNNSNNNNNSNSNTLSPLEALAEGVMGDSSSSSLGIAYKNNTNTSSTVSKGFRSSVKTSRLASHKRSGSQLSHHSLDSRHVLHITNGSLGVGGGSSVGYPMNKLCDGVLRTSRSSTNLDLSLFHSSNGSLNDGSASGGQSYHRDSQSDSTLDYRTRSSSSLKFDSFEDFSKRNGNNTVKSQDVSLPVISIDNLALSSLKQTNPSSPSLSLSALDHDKTGAGRGGEGRPDTLSDVDTVDNDSDWVDVESIRGNESQPGSSNAPGEGEGDGAEEEKDSASTLTDTMITQNVHSTARLMLDAGTITETEYEILLKGHDKYREMSAREESLVASARLSKCFGETWDELKVRVLGSGGGRLPDSVLGSERGGAAEEQEHEFRWPRRDLRSFIVKSNDDLRQEMCCMQLIRLCQDIFQEMGLAGDLWLKPYRIIATGASTGVIEVLPDTMSLDALKKSQDFVSLPKYFDRVYGTSPERLGAARRNFMVSLAAYSLLSHIFLIKDRHNGNILIDKDGHVIHIDFGFLLGIAPGGSFSLEAAPFKFTEEMLEVFGGLDSPLFGEFVRGFTAGFLALQTNVENIVSTLDMLAQDSPFPCFMGKDKNAIIDRLRGRFRTDLNAQQSFHHCLDLITQSYGNLGTRQYDNFQWFTNGIMT